MVKKLSSNNFYSMYQFDNNDNDFSCMQSNTLKTLFLHKGILEIELSFEDKDKKINLTSHQGLVILPDVKINIVKNDSYLILVQSIEDDKPIIDITIDEKGNREEKKIEKYKIIDNPI